MLRWSHVFNATLLGVDNMLKISVPIKLNRGQIIKIDKVHFRPYPWHTVVIEATIIPTPLSDGSKCDTPLGERRREPADLE